MKVGRGTILTGGEVFTDGNINRTYKCPMQDDDGSIKNAFVKIIGAREVYVEVLCAILAKTLGYNVPEPYVVLIPANALPDTSLPENVISFASIDAGHPSLKRRCNPGNDIMIRKLYESAEAHKIGAFDEWIANPDRHIGNILYDGGDSFWFIDHGLSLDPRLPANGFLSQNKIVDSMRQYMTVEEIHDFLYEIASIEIAKFSRVKMSMNKDNEILLRLQNEIEIEKDITFLRKRVETVFHHISNRVGVSHLELVNE